MYQHPIQLYKIHCPLKHFPFFVWKARLLFFFKYFYFILFILYLSPPSRWLFGGGGGWQWVSDGTFLFYEHDEIHDLRWLVWMQISVSAGQNCLGTSHTRSEAVTCMFDVSLPRMRSTSRLRDLLIYRSFEHAPIMTFWTIYKNKLKLSNRCYYIFLFFIVKMCEM